MIDKPYAILSIPLLCLFLYFASLLMVYLGIISRITHRKYWNVLLLAAFLGAAGLGFLLALQVNLKFDLPAASTFLICHVDFGIGLLVIASLHLSWHLKYFLEIIKPRSRVQKSKQKGIAQITDDQKDPFEKRQSGEKTIFLLLPFSLGLTAMASQIILLREFLAVFNGNELEIGVILANWMLLTGLGAWLGKFVHHEKRQTSRIAFTLLALSILAPVTLFILDSMRNVVFTTGSMAGIYNVFLMSVFLLAPFCLLSGSLFTRLSSIMTFHSKDPATGLVYSWENIGSVTGGALFNFILVFFLKPFQALTVIVIVNALILGWFLFKERQKSLLPGIAVISIVFVALVLSVNPDTVTRKFLFPGQKILTYRDTPFGNMVVTESGGQKNVYENNTLLYTTNNVITNEETVHYAMLQRKNPVNVLLIGGGFSGIVGEILKYPIKDLDNIEMNPWLAQVAGTLSEMPEDDRLKVVLSDPRSFTDRLVKREATHNNGAGSSRYDVILLNLPDPSTLQLNRFYSVEFMTILKPLLRKGGVVSLSLMATADYMGYSSKRAHLIMYATLKKVFKNVLVVPGDRDYFLGSDSVLRIDMASLQTERGVETDYVNPYYLEDESLQQRSRTIMQDLQPGAPINRDFKPLAYQSQVKYCLDYFGHDLGYLPLLLLLLLLPVLFRSDSTTVGLFTAGFAASASEVIILLAFQVIYGYIFLAAGMIITVFMLGLALGAAYARKYFRIVSSIFLVRLQFAMAICILVILVAIIGFHRFHSTTVAIHAGFAILTLMLSILTGMIFQVAAVVKQGEVRSVAGSLYSADLLGSAIGALIVSTWLMPMLGLSGTLMAISGACLLSVLIMALKRKRAG